VSSYRIAKGRAGRAGEAGQKKVANARVSMAAAWGSEGGHRRGREKKTPAQHGKRPDQSFENSRLGKEKKNSRERGARGITEPQLGRGSGNWGALRGSTVIREEGKTGHNLRGAKRVFSTQGKIMGLSGQGVTRGGQSMGKPM